MKVQVNKRAMLLYILLAMSSFSFAACNQNGRNEKEQQQVQTVITPQTTSENPQHAVPDVIFLDENGKTVSLKSLKGKVVFINFWATWCPPCIQEMPSIHKLKQSFKDSDKIVFLMVDVDGDIKKSQAFMKNHKYDLQVYSPHGDIPSDFLGSAIPTTVILAKDGDIVVRSEGGRDYTDPKIMKALNDLVESKY